MRIELLAVSTEIAWMVSAMGCYNGISLTFGIGSHREVLDR